MSEITNIPWCDSTISDWPGCSKVSAGCLNCFAEVFDARGCIEKVSHWGPGAPRLQLKGAAKARAKLNRKPIICDTCGTALVDGYALHDCNGDHDARPFSFHRRRIFNQNLGDWLDPEVPIELLVGMLESIRLADKCTHILCTKRPENFFRRLSDCLWHEPIRQWVGDWVGVERKAPSNIWLLTSVENQDAADKRIPELLRIPAAVRGLSVEPLVGPIDLTTCGYLRAPAMQIAPTVEWVIVGGESGALARPCNVDWIRSIISQCNSTGTPCFVKQLGSCAVEHEIQWADRQPYRLLDASKIKMTPFAHVAWKLTHPKGADPAEWTEDLRVRQFPNQ